MRGPAPRADADGGLIAAGGDVVGGGGLRYRRDMAMSDPGAPRITPQHPSVSTLEPEVDVRPTTDDGDHDRFAHICKKEDVARAYVTGEAIEALCGKKWVPSRDPEAYPVCEMCKEALGRVHTADQN